MNYPKNIMMLWEKNVPTLLLEALDAKNEGISVTAWDTRGDLETYEKSGDYQKIVTKFKAMFADEPVLKSYEVTANSEPIILRIF